MSYLTTRWSFDPFLIIAVAVVALHEIGLWRLRLRSRPERSRGRRRRSVVFYSGLAVLLIAVESPVDYWAGRYFFLQMVQHLLLMFAAPTLIVAGAPWQPLMDAFPGRAGRSVTREVLSGRWSRPLRAAGGLPLRGWTAVAFFNVVMVAWHLPVLFDGAERSQAVRIWLMHGTFLVAGVVFWLQFIESPPFRPRMPQLSQAAALVLTSLVMWMLAMSMLGHSSWYPVYAHHSGVTQPHDQNIGAGILWAGGGLWVLCALIVLLRRLIAAEGGADGAVEAILNPGGTRRPWVTGAGAASPVSGTGREPL